MNANVEPSGSFAANANAVARHGLKWQRPPHRRLPVALAAGFGLGIPITVGAALGELAWGLVAASGGFLAVYFPDQSRARRRRSLPIVALTVLAAALAGVTTAPTLLGSLFGVATVAVLATGLFCAVGVGAPGALAPTVVAGMTGRAAAPADLGGLALPAGTVVALVAVGLFGAYLLASFPLRLPRRADTARSDGAWGSDRGPEQREWFVLQRLDAPQFRWTAMTVTCVLPFLVAWPQAQAYWVFVAIVGVLQASGDSHATVAR